MSRLFWFMAGVATTVAVAINGRRWVRQFTPKGVAERVENTGRRAASSIGEFYATFQSAKRAREEELRQELNLEVTT